MATTTRSVYFVYDPNSDTQGKVFSNLDLTEFTNLGRVSNWTIIEDVDKCISVLGLTGGLLKKQTDFLNN